MNKGLMLSMMANDRNRRRERSPYEEEEANARRYQGNRRRQPNQYTSEYDEYRQMPEREPVNAYPYHQPPYSNIPEWGEQYGRIENRMIPSYPKYPDYRENGLYDGGKIGFGAEERHYRTRNHYGDGESEHQKKMIRAGGTFWMDNDNDHEESEPFTRETAEEWVRSMKNSDSTQPTGAKWAPEEIKPLAQKLGIRTDGEQFWEFFAMMNAMYSDYAEVAKKFGIVSPEFYACMAKAWMKDKDANEEKTKLYYRYIVKK